MQLTTREPPTIDHNPHERREPWWSWWAIWAGVGVFWLLFLGETLNWKHIGLGFLTGMFFGMWAMDMTGGEVPSSWRSKPRRRD